MLQTVLRIPHEVGGLPLFGYGWVAAALALGLAGVILTAILKPAMRNDVIQASPMLIIMLVVSIWVMPHLEEQGPNNTSLGLPIRGYGVMLVAGVVSGFALTVARGRRMGFNPDRVLTMLVGMFVTGILGARVFHVIQYWDRIYDGSVRSTLIRAVKFNEGGLVVYGSLIAGLIWVIYYTQKEKWSLLRTGDMIAPGMLLGLALGRIGCLLNGCCHGGACEGEMFALQFPQGSPPYMSQLEGGELLGLKIAQVEDEGYVVESVEAGEAEDAGVRPGDHVLMLPSDKKLRDSILLDDGSAMVVIETNRSNAKWTVDDLPPKSLPTRPAQIYSSINAALICLLLLAIHPYRTRDGQLILLLLTLYPVTRFLLEVVRTDEPGRFGTSLTISQWVSVGILAVAAIGWLAVQRGWIGAETRETDAGMV